MQAACRSPLGTCSPLSLRYSTHELFEFASRRALQLAFDIAEANAKWVPQRLLNNLDQARLGGWLQLGFHDQTHLDLLEIVLNQLILQDFADFAVAVQPHQRPVALAVR